MVKAVTVPFGSAYTLKKLENSLRGRPDGVGFVFINSINLISQSDDFSSSSMSNDSRFDRAVVATSETKLSSFWLLSRSLVVPRLNLVCSAASSISSSKATSTTAFYTFFAFFFFFDF